MIVNPFDRVQYACENPSLYPTHLLRSGLLQHAISEYTELLDERDEYIFRRAPPVEDPWKIRLWDRYDGEKGFPDSPQVCQSEDDLRKYLGVNRKDPRCRHVFLRASHSRAPLNCSREMFLTILSYHQVMVQFLDIASNFGSNQEQDIPTAAQQYWFHHQEFLGSNDAEVCAIPRLGRSGLEIKYCYNLWGVEKSSAAKRPWEIRQAGTYHSLDMENGRAAWIHVKGHTKSKFSLEKRIREATATCFKQPDDSISDSQLLQESLLAALSMHIVKFEWSCENWRRYLFHLECQLEKVLTKIKKAPINKAETMLTDTNAAMTDAFGSLSRQGTLAATARVDLKSVGSSPRSFSVVSGSRACPSVQAPPRQIRSALSSPVSPAKSTFSNIDTINERTEMKYSPSGEQWEDPLRLLGEFKFQDLQNLHHIGSKLREADMVLELNSKTMIEVANYIKRIIGSPQVPEATIKGCQSALVNFTERTGSIAQGLSTNRARITTLLALLEDGKALFDAITQFRNIELNKLSATRMELMANDMQTMTLDMRESTFKMESIAEGTGKETSSMHTITLVTLVFLPGTFVAVRYALLLIWTIASMSLTTVDYQTFLGAGFYQFPDEVGGEAVFPLFQTKYFALFAAITFPLTAITVFLWFIGPRVWNGAKPAGIMQRLTERRGHKNMLDDEAGSTARGARKWGEIGCIL
ncbi:hypothetical protein F4808DRAFT_127586 [Astrocystis sublimbata]|nr:hypothetical protein F4808DRAFT_127586 [Astrocystis sublimbata]